jgi:hypothetical protein
VVNVDKSIDNEIFVGHAVTEININIPSWKYLVYSFRMPDYIRCDRHGESLNGSNVAGYLFDSLEAAKVFAKRESNKTTKVGFGVYNSSWQILETYLSDEYKKRDSKANSPSRLFLWAAALLGIGTLLVWLDVRSSWSLVFGFLIGSRFLFAGFLKFGTAIYQVMRHDRPA